LSFISLAVSFGFVNANQYVTFHNFFNVAPANQEINIAEGTAIAAVAQAIFHIHILSHFSSVISHTPPQIFHIH
jgi:hypothetical protein